MSLTDETNVTPPEEVAVAAAVALTTAAVAEADAKIFEHGTNPGMPPPEGLTPATSGDVPQYVIPPDYAAHAPSEAETMAQAIGNAAAMAEQRVVDTLETIAAGAERVIEAGITEVETVAKVVEAKVAQVWDAHQQKHIPVA